MTEHIDRARLYTDIRYHFEYISKFLNFTKDDIHTINSLAPVLFPHIPNIVEIVYSKLCSFDITRQCFAIPNDDSKSCSSIDESTFSILTTSTDILKDVLSIYLKRILIQTEWNDLFLKYLSEMGELYGDKNCFKNFKIDYMHINVLVGHLEHTLIEVIWEQENFDLKKKQTAIKALNKLFWIQNNLFTMYYELSLKESSTTKRRIKKH